MNMCLGCDTPLDPLWANVGLHPTCTDPVADQLKEELSAIITWASSTSPRSLQTTLGPSELGTPCDRRLAYRLAGTQTFNDRLDPLIAMVGTGIHSWMEQAIRRFNQTFGDDTLTPETRVVIDSLLAGTSDLYHKQLRAVVDFKSAGADVLKKVPNVGPEPGYRVQIHLYGLGYENAGLPVDQVMLVYIPRSGLLKGIHVWREPYDRSVAVRALERRDLISQSVADGASFADFPAEVSEKDCYFCPFRSRMDMLMGPTAAFGCPGVRPMG